MAGFSARQMVATGSGLIPMASLSGSTAEGCFQVLELTFSDGGILRCAEDQRLLGSDGEMLRAVDLLVGERVTRTSHHVPRREAETRLPAVAADVATRSQLNLPMEWDEALAHYLGWLVGDGSFSPRGAVTIYGSATEVEELLPWHRNALERWTGFRPKPSVQPNGTVQVRAMKRDFVDYLLALGVAQTKSAAKVVPGSMLVAPQPALLPFLRGLFDADGCVVSDVRKGSHYVGLGSKSLELLRTVQSLLISLDIGSRIYRTSRGGRTSFTHTRKDGQRVSYRSPGPSYDLRITGRSIRQFEHSIGFELSYKRHRLRELVSRHSFHNVREEVALVTAQTRLVPESTFGLPSEWSGLVDGFVCEPENI